MNWAAQTQHGPDPFAICFESYDCYAELQIMQYSCDSHDKPSDSSQKTKHPPISIAQVHFRFESRLESCDTCNTSYHEHNQIHSIHFVQN